MRGETENSDGRLREQIRIVKDSNFMNTVSFSFRNRCTDIDKRKLQTLLVMSVAFLADPTQ